MNSAEKWLQMLQQQSTYFGLQYPPDMLETVDDNTVCTPRLFIQEDTGVEYQIVWIVATKKQRLDRGWFERIKQFRMAYEVVFIVDADATEATDEKGLYYYTLGPLKDNGVWQALVH